jgi:hypothetical protein
VAALAAACDRRAAPADRRSVVEQAVAIAPEIERATGLRFTAPPKVEVRSRAQVRAFVTRVLDEPGAREDIAAQGMAYQRLGAVPDTADYRALLARLLGEQVAGYYDPRSKTLYVVQGVDSAAASTTLRHELVHALQDQHRNLDSLLRTRGQADRSTAAQAALEGQATWAQLGGGTDLGSRVPGGWERVRQLIRDNANRAPSWPRRRSCARGPAVPVPERRRAGARRGARRPPRLGDRRLPQSTEQVLHTGAYLGARGVRPDAPLTVTLRRRGRGGGGGEHVSASSTRGSCSTSTPGPGSRRAGAQGWGGDRWALVRPVAGPGPWGDDAGAAFVWLTVWDAQVDAGEFLEAMTEFRPPSATPARGPPPRRGAGGPGGPAGAARARRGAPRAGRRHRGRARVHRGRRARRPAPAAAPRRRRGRPPRRALRRRARRGGTDLVDLARATARP